MRQAWCETQSSSSTEKTTEKSQAMFKMSTISTNTSTQAWPFVNCVINQRLLQASPHMQQTLLQLISVMTVTSYLRDMKQVADHCLTMYVLMFLFIFYSPQG